MRFFVVLFLSLRTLEGVSEVMNNSASFDLYARFLCALCFLIDTDSVDIVGDHICCLVKKFCVFRVSPRFFMSFSFSSFPHTNMPHCFQYFSVSFAPLELICSDF